MYIYIYVYLYYIYLCICISIYIYISISISISKLTPEDAMDFSTRVGRIVSQSIGACTRYIYILTHM